mgnify:FL=1
MLCPPKQPATPINEVGTVANSARRFIREIIPISIISYWRLKGTVESADPHAYVDINQSDVNRFTEISESDTLYKDIIGSIAPMIKDYEKEKLALALQLFGGIEKDLPDGSTV